MCECCSSLDVKVREQVLHENTEDIDAMMRLFVLVLFCAVGS
jgi:hypothetical protein